MSDDPYVCAACGQPKPSVSSKPSPSWAMRDGVSYRLEEECLELEQRLASAKALIAQVADMGCEYWASGADCWTAACDSPCGPCRARRWREAQQ